MSGAFVLLLAACGGSDDSGDGKSGSSAACISNDGDGRPGLCTVYAGSIYRDAGGMDLLCPVAHVEHLERAKRCPTGEGLVGHCKHNAGEVDETQFYYYLYDDVDGEGAAFLQDTCESNDGIWRS